MLSFRIKQSRGRLNGKGCGHDEHEGDGAAEETSKGDGEAINSGEAAEMIGVMDRHVWGILELVLRQLSLIDIIGFL